MSKRMFTNLTAVRSKKKYHPISTNPKIGVRGGKLLRTHGKGQLGLKELSRYISYSIRVGGKIKLRLIVYGDISWNFNSASHHENPVRWFDEMMARVKICKWPSDHDHKVWL